MHKIAEKKVEGFKEVVYCQSGDILLPSTSLSITWGFDNG